MKLASKFTNFTSLNRFSLILTSCAVFGLISSKPSIAAVMYSVTDIGTLGGSGSRAIDINDNGQVVGTSSDSNYNSQAFLWDSTSGIRSLDPNGIGSSSANKINNNGQVVGSKNSRAFLWDSVNGLQNLATLPNDSFSTANAINDKGQVVGSLQNSSGSQTFLWDSVNGLQNLGTLNGYDGTSPRDINNNGEVVGFASYNPNRSLRAVLWDSSKGIQDLGGLSRFNTNLANSINDTGTVVGSSSITDRISNAFLWDSTKGIQNLGTLDGDIGSSARDINNLGQVVGITSFNRRPVLWENGIITDLNTLIDPSSGWRLQSAVAINNKGQIVGEGILNNQGSARAFLLTPLTQIPKSIPEPSSGLGLCAFTLGSIYGLKRRYAKSSPISKNKRTLKIAGS